MDWGTVVTSAAIGSVVSSVVGLIGQRAERSARKRELLLTRAVEMARIGGPLHRENVAKRAAGMGLTVLAKDDIFFVEKYFRQLTRIFEKGALDPEEHEAFRKDLDEHLERQRRG